MRVLLLLGSVAAGAVAAPMPGAAQDYPWCANFADGAGANCGFATYQQCMETARGSGGTCEENGILRSPSAAAPPRDRATKRNQVTKHSARKNS